MARKPLSNALKVLYGIVSVPNLYWTIMFGAFGAFFITNILKLPASVYAVSQSAGNLISFFIVPVFAALINNGKPGRWGKVRKWTLIGPVIGIIIGGVDFSSWGVQVGDASILFGNFIQAIINFLITAIVLFFIMKSFNTFKDKAEKLAKMTAAEITEAT